MELKKAVDERIAMRAMYRHRQRRNPGAALGGAPIRVRDLEVVLTGNLVVEELTSSAMHGTGFILSVIGAFPLLQVAKESKDSFHFWGVVVYTVALLAMYLSTTLGHSFFQYQRASAVFQAIDRSAICTSRCLCLCLCVCARVPVSCMHLRSTPLIIVRPHLRRRVDSRHVHAVFARQPAQ